jgi:DNA-directed RNA polymerase specialized sigma24 family protein
MTRVGPDEDSHDDAEQLMAAWRARDDAREVFETVVGPMRQAARQGIRRILGEDPDEHDVEDVVVKAFKEYLRKSAKEPVRHPVGLAKRIANFRGRDHARAIRREREGIDDNAWVIDELRIPDEDAEAAAESEELASMAMDCMENLTADQRDVIEATDMRLRSLSDWASAHGITHQAASQMRLRGLRALRRCIDAKRAADGRRSTDA